MPADRSRSLPEHHRIQEGKRGWWREYFHDHPGFANKEPGSFNPSNQQPYVYCKKCMDLNIRQEREGDQLEVMNNLRPSVRTEESIKATRKFMRLHVVVCSPAGWQYGPFR